MSIIYAPYIEEMVPAFTADYLKINFTQHPGVPINGQVTSMCIKILDMNDELVGGQVYFCKYYSCTEGWLEFEPQSELLQINQHYKFQIAYVENEEIGPYSEVAIGKCIQKPEAVLKFNSDEPIEDIKLYVVSYLSTISEPIYSYRFYVEDGTEIPQDSGVLIHNTTNDRIVDNKRNSQLIFYFSKYFNPEEQQSPWQGVLHCFITTLNGYSIHLEQKIIQSQQLTNAEDSAVIVQSNIQGAAGNQSSSKIQAICAAAGAIYVEFKLNTDYNTSLYRTSEKTNFTLWEQIATFNKGEGLKTYYDTTVEQDIQYQYAICLSYGIDEIPDTAALQLIGNGEKVYSDFEHMFLSDNEKFLAISLNPRVSSFKTTILESKMDTIGGKYPFFFRNGNVGYQEIPINGLISYQMDELEGFMKKSDLGINELRPQTSNLVGYNVAAERKFKMEVLAWLNNGKPKLFRSPTEGNFIIRLMNVSLSPNDTLGRMIHSFQATGYEIGDANKTEDLIKHKVVYNNGFTEI